MERSVYHKVEAILHEIAKSDPNDPGAVGRIMDKYGLSQQDVDDLVRAGLEKRTKQSDPVPTSTKTPLNTRQQIVKDASLAGLNSQQISEQLGLPKKTVVAIKSEIARKQGPLRRKK